MQEHCSNYLNPVSFIMNINYYVFRKAFETEEVKKEIWTSKILIGYVSGTGGNIKKKKKN